MAAPRDLVGREVSEGDPALLDAVFAVAPVGLALLDRELRFERVNDQLAAMDDVPVSDHIGRRVQEVLPEIDRRVIADVEKLLQTGEEIVDAKVSGTLAGRPDVRRHWQVSCRPALEPGGEITGIAVAVTEVTERRQAETEHAGSVRRLRVVTEQARFLAEASAALVASLDYEETLGRIARLAVPAMADWCSVDVFAPDGTVENVALAHADPSKVARAAELNRRYPVDPDAETGVPNVGRTGRSELYEEITDAMLTEAAVDPEHLAILRSLSMTSAMIVPMSARGRTLGTITFVAAESASPFTAEDVNLAEDLARRAALAVDNARLYAARTHIARTLQESLLPPELPVIPGIELAARFAAAGAINEVGGDFYDVFEIVPGRWGVVMGDVCGKGPEAAAVTALARHTTRAAADRDVRPSIILRALHDALVRQRNDGRFLTAAFVVLDEPTDGAPGARLVSSRGGHPAPLVLRADGSTEWLGVPGSLLGSVVEPQLTETGAELHPGDALVLYTDGVSDAGVVLDKLLAPHAGAPADELARLVSEAARPPGGGQTRDDVAIVVLRAPDALSVR